MGRGSYGAVVKARKDGRLYAVKALADNRGDEAGSVPFQLEAEILSRLTNPRVPRFVESFTFGHAYYIIQEYIAGQPLSCFVDNGYRFTEAEVKAILMQLLFIIRDLHCPAIKENAVIHRDIRLSNLLLCEGKLYLIDFGLARFLDPNQFAFCPDPPGNSCGKNDILLDGPARKIPGADTYRLLRKEISPQSDLLGAGVIAVDLFSNSVDDEALFKLPWDKVLTLSEAFTHFLKKLLSRKNGFDTAAEALKCLIDQAGELYASGKRNDAG